MFSFFTFDENKFYEGCAALVEQMANTYDYYTRNRTATKKAIPSLQQRLVNAKHQLADQQIALSEKMTEIAKLEVTLIETQEKCVNLEPGVATQGLFAPNSNTPSPVFITDIKELEMGQTEAEEKLAQIQQGLGALNQELSTLINSNNIHNEGIGHVRKNT